MDVVKQAVKNLHRTASVCPTTSTRLTYRDLLLSADRISQSIHKTNGGASSMSDHQPPRVGLFATPGPEYLAASMAVWKSGGIVVPLATSHPPRELAYVLSDAGIKTVLTGKGDASKLRDVTSEANAQLVLMDTIEPSTTSLPSSHSADFGSISPSSGALIIYTSGTTGKPKGVLHTHGSISAQVQGLVEAWQWSMEDRILHTLPLHHIHGIVNALYCPAFVGAQIQVRDQKHVSTHMGTNHGTNYLSNPTTQHAYDICHHKLSLKPSQHSRSSSPSSALQWSGRRS